MPERLEITRYDLTRVIDERGCRVGAEIGVEHGYFSYYLLKHSDLSELHSIDPYQGKWGPCQQDAASLLHEFGESSVLRVSTSEEAAQHYASIEKRFDFVYLDGDHRYRAVKRDIASWWPLVRSGGMLAGHDYCAAGAGVVRAVDEFVREERLTLFVTREAWASWLVYKP